MRTRDTVAAWTAPDVTRYAIAKRFHNMLLQWTVRERVDFLRLLDLFAEPPPQGSGLYNHHDGRRPGDVSW